MSDDAPSGQFVWYDTRAGRSVSASGRKASPRGCNLRGQAEPREFDVTNGSTTPRQQRNTGGGLRKCMWADCPQYGLGETRLCKAHLIIVVRHAQDEAPDIARVVTALSAPFSEPRLTKAQPKDGTIYYLRSGGFIKIGWTSDLGKRMRAYPPDTVLLAVRPGTRSDENATHKRFAHLITHGREWFPLAPQISEHIDQVLAEYGPPPTVEFAARKSAPAMGQRQYVGGPNRGKLAARQVRG